MLKGCHVCEGDTTGFHEADGISGTVAPETGASSWSMPDLPTTMLLCRALLKS